MKLYCYSNQSEEICLTFYPCRNTGMTKPFDDAYQHKNPLRIYRTDYDRLILPCLKQIFPLRNPTTQEIQEEFDLFFDNWISKEDISRFIGMLEERTDENLPEEAQFYQNMIQWLKTELSCSDLILIEGNQ